MSFRAAVLSGIGQALTIESVAHTALAQTDVLIRNRASDLFVSTADR